MSNYKRFEGKTAVVTGAAAGIGLEITRQLLQGGAQVIMNDIDRKAARECMRQLTEEFPGMIDVVIGDASSEDIIAGLIESAVTHFGGVDIAIANAGITYFGDFFEFNRSDFAEMIDLNLKGSFFLAQAAARQMRSQGRGGRILFTSSVMGMRAASELTAYAMTKAALSMMARNLVMELSPFGINVNCIAPGATLTSRTVLETPDYARNWSEVIPLGKSAIPEDIAAPALFLLSEAANHITGQTLIIDGGWTSVSPLPESMKRKTNAK